MYSMILARDLDFQIGYEFLLPWYYKEDLIHFKRKTWNKTIVMGRHTYHSFYNSNLGKHIPLANRRNIVISSKLKEVSEGFELFRSIDKVKRHINEQTFIIGGVSLWTEFMPDISRVYLTEIHNTHHGNVRYFDNFINLGFTEIGRKTIKQCQDHLTSDKVGGDVGINGDPIRFSDLTFIRYAR